MLGNIQIQQGSAADLSCRSSFNSQITPVEVLSALKSWTKKATLASFLQQIGLAGQVVRIVSEDDDKLQIERIVNGDKDAVGVLYARYQKRVFHFVRRFVNDVEVAEDLTNDIFIELWHKASNYEGRSKVSSWLLGIARYKALSEVRKRKPVHSKSEEILDAIEDDADDPEMVSQKMDKGAAIKRCIAKLSQDHRVILELIYYQEKSMEEVAEILDIPKNTVKTRTFHARKQLSTEMTACGLDRGWP